MDPELLNTLVIALLGTGGATFIWTLVRSFIALRNSAEGREDKAVARLEKFESECRAQLTRERQWGAYWNSRAATFEHALRSNGITVPPNGDPPPLI